MLDTPSLTHPKLNNAMFAFPSALLSVSKISHLVVNVRKLVVILI